jgi:inorganic phosphate transporter, PiT family
MVEALLLVGILIAIFAGFNIGGSSAGICWGVPVGANLISKTAAAGLFTIFVFLGGWTVGRRVIDTLGEGIVPGDLFTIQVSIIVLGFIALGMLVANLFGVPVPTSMAAVGAIAGLGLATDTLNFETMGRIVSWWVVTPVIAFWIGGVVGRYIYPYPDKYFQSHRSPGPFFVLDRSGIIPRPALGPNTTYQEVASVSVVIGIACYMAFSAGAANVANAVAPLVGSGLIGVGPAVIIATFGIGLGGFTIARRTMDSVGNDLTELPLLAAVVVAITAATITTGLASIGIPISLVMATVMTIVGLGWGRASRTATLEDVVRGEAEVDLTMNPLLTEAPEKTPRMGEETIGDLDTGDDLVRPREIARFVSFWIIGPSVSAGATYVFFTLVPLAG